MSQMAAPGKDEWAAAREDTPETRKWYRRLLQCSQQPFAMAEPQEPIQGVRRLLAAPAGTWTSAANGCSTVTYAYPDALYGDHVAYMVDGWSACGGRAAVYLILLSTGQKVAYNNCADAWDACIYQHATEHLATLLRVQFPAPECDVDWDTILQGK